ncbi:toll/interleukin-1 receptor domain-containing protein [Nitrosomonas aestuarii]|uniref:toll/interleukin-1 receptor domain-containing protein n=1 Tax=Nitrosomonas aestuarii TaxID=52441 RepID=UPI000D4D7EA7|nr:toll/interleukin-1 receptor domain-containing protein [Nitrosomonas aestuarii]PTN12516.1 pentapeptide repeat protein [Nitrosomonas aestuarii]
MDNQKSVELLCAGVSEWNRYRDDTMDLSHLDIRNANLSRANFGATNFDGTRLLNVNMSNCDLIRARFNGVSATLTDFSESSFDDAEIKGTDLNKCCLNKSTIHRIESYLWKNRHTSFVGAEINALKLSHAHFYNCNFTACKFHGDSFDATDIKRGQIDSKLESYLAKKGVNFELVRQPYTDDWIDWENVQLPKDSKEFGVIIYNYEAYWITENRWDVFISYQTAQKGFANNLADEIKMRGLKVWFDSATLAANDSLLQCINVGLNACPFGVVILSEEYFGRKWTEYELKKLLSKKMIIILHDIQLDKVVSFYPGLDDKIMLTSELGVKSLSHMIAETIRRPPRNLLSGVADQ